MPLAPSRWSRRAFLRHLGAGALSIGLWSGAGWLAGGRTDGPPTPCLRPPGALSEREFLATCLRCGRCAAACPNRSIVAFTPEFADEHSMMPGAGQFGTPVIFPRRQACMLCAGVPGGTLLCTGSCPSGALRPVAKTREGILERVSMGTAVIDRNLCYSYNHSSCGVCVRACPFEGEALRAGMWEKPVLDPDACVGCGSCERSCVRYPGAIRVEPRPIG